MNYYRITFHRITCPDPLNKPFHRKWQWFDLVCEAKSRTDAKAHGLQVAYDNEVTFVDAMRLLRVKGAAMINREPAFQELP